MDLPTPLRRVFAAMPDATLGAFAPGRVNLIGEHTDYSGLPVLPFALPFGVAIAARPRHDDLVCLRHLEPDRFAAAVIPRAELANRPRTGTWVDYVVAGLRCQPPANGVDLLLGADLPIAAGLSSSAALVCAAALLFAPRDVDRLHLAEQCAAAERYVGTEAGGMDQAAALLGQPGHALFLHFRPLRATAVPLPHSAAVVVADSGVRAEKGGALQAAYNERVHQCRRAASLLGAPAGGLLGDVPTSQWAASAALADPLLRRRAGFVFAEAARTSAAVAALRQGDLPELGRLLTSSHRGLTDDYEVGHPAVDALVRAAHAAGAFGARIVGAGFGGSAIALGTRETAAAIAAAMRAAGAVSTFVAEPSAGACRVAGPKAAPNAG
ncbi:MAG: galactokinase [Planctomycetes bacterium]|nr:galactokinase [Planctomycetota bacterium]